MERKEMIQVSPGNNLGLLPSKTTFGHEKLSPFPPSTRSQPCLFSSNEHEARTANTPSEWLARGIKNERIKNARRLRLLLMLVVHFKSSRALMLFLIP